MKKFSKITLFLILSFFIFSLAFGFYCLALEQPLEQLPPEAGRSLPELIVYIFNFALGIGGITALTVIIIAGFRWMLSAAAPEQKKGAMDQIKAGIFGLLILLASYLILTTINPQLTMLKMPGLASPPTPTPLPGPTPTPTPTPTPVWDENNIWESQKNPPKIFSQTQKLFSTAQAQAPAPVDMAECKASGPFYATNECHVSGGPCETAEIGISSSASQCLFQIAQLPRKAVKENVPRNVYEPIVSQYLSTIACLQGVADSYIRIFIDKCCCPGYCCPPTSCCPVMGGCIGEGAKCQGTCGDEIKSMTLLSKVEKCAGNGLFDKEIDRDANKLAKKCLVKAAGSQGVIEGVSGCPSGTCRPCACTCCDDKGNCWCCVYKDVIGIRTVGTNSDDFFECLADRNLLLSGCIGLTDWEVEKIGDCSKINMFRCCR